MVRLKDIAQQVGLSIMTVSKALRGAPDISPKTMTRIKLAAQQMGYVPNATAQGLRNRCSRLLGLVVPNIANPIFARMGMAIEDRAHEAGYQIILAQSQNIVEREDACLRQLLARRVDGLFVMPAYRPSPEARAYDELLASGTPTVILGPPAPFCSRFVNVQGEESEGSFRLTQHLIELGHRRIAFFCGPSRSPWGQARLDGYARALRQANLEVDDKLIFPAGGTIEDGAAAALQWTGEATGATAIQAVNDMVAIGCGETLLSQGLRIPQDISLTGYGNILAAEHFRVPLTTVRQPKHRLGEAALSVMLQLLAGGKPKPQRLPVSLVIRASTGTPSQVPVAPTAPPELT